MNEKKLNHTKKPGYYATLRLVLCALFVAMGAILSVLAIPLFGDTVRISFGKLPVILSGIFFGPVYGGIVGALADMLPALLFPRGAFQPWFTVIGVFFGLIPGLFFMKQQKPTFKRIFLAVFIGQTFCSVICNTALNVWLYNADPLLILPARALNQAITIPVFAYLVNVIVRITEKQPFFSGMQSRP